MLDPINLTLISMQSDMARMNVVANNAANALTPGFKKAYVTVERSLGLNELSIDKGDRIHGGAFVTKVLTDFSSGTLRQTGNPLDVALLDRGYLEVATDSGVAYTRVGALRVDPGGRLVTQGGLAVAGVAGDIVLTTPMPVIDREGKVFEAGKPVAQIKVVDFVDSAVLSPIGGGLFVASADIHPALIERPRIVQGQLENSNVDSTYEMVKLLETFRHFESSSRVLQSYDDLRDKVFRSLGQF